MRPCVLCLNNTNRKLLHCSVNSEEWPFLSVPGILWMHLKTSQNEELELSKIIRDLDL